MIAGEVVPVVFENEFFEGIASWTTEIDYARKFKALIKANTKFTMVFKHKPLPGEVVVNIIALWADEGYRNAVNKLNDTYPEIAYPLLNFKDFQSEIIMRSTLRREEIEDMVGMSHSWETICDMTDIPVEMREELSIKYAQDPDGIPVEMNVFAGRRATKAAIEKTLKDFRSRVENASRDKKLYDWSKAAVPHPEDLKHRLTNQ